MSNLYLNKADQEFLSKKLAWVEEILIDDQADDAANVDRHGEIEHCRKLRERIAKLGH